MTSGQGPGAFECKRPCRTRHRTPPLTAAPGLTALHLPAPGQRPPPCSQHTGCRRCGLKGACRAAGARAADRRTLLPGESARCLSSQEQRGVLTPAVGGLPVTPVTAIPEADSMV